MATLLAKLSGIIGKLVTLIRVNAGKALLVTLVRGNARKPVRATASNTGKLVSGNAGTW